MRKYLLLGLVFSVFLMGCSGDKEVAKTADAVKQQPVNQQAAANIEANYTKESLVKYTVEKEEDISTGSAKIYSIRAIVPVDISGDGIKEVSKEIINNFIAFNEVNAVNILMYGLKKDIEGTFTVAKVEWAPYGDWAKASEMATGDYSKHDYKYEIKKSNNNVKLNQQELAIYNEFQALINSSNNPSLQKPPSNLKKEEFQSWMKELEIKVRLYEENGKEIVAKKYKITNNQLDEIIIKAMVYK